MSEFINTADVIGDDEMCDQIIMRTVTEYKENRITRVGPYAFYNCVALTEVDLPNVTEIGRESFSGCESLTSVNLPEVTTIGQEAFKIAAKCRVVLPKWTTSGAYPFLSSQITGIIAPAVTALGSSTFRFAYLLKYADFASLTSIKGNNNFNGVPLDALVLRSTTMCTLSSVTEFDGSSISGGTGYIYVPSALIDAYKADTNWSLFADQFRVLEEYTVDGTIDGEFDETKI